MIVHNQLHRTTELNITETTLCTTNSLSGECRKNAIIQNESIYRYDTNTPINDTCLMFHLSTMIQSRHLDWILFLPERYNGKRCLSEPFRKHTVRLWHLDKLWNDPNHVPAATFRSAPRGDAQLFASIEAPIRYQNDSNRLGPPAALIP